MQLAGFVDHQHLDDALPDVVFTFEPLMAANLGEWLEELGQRAIRNA